MGYYPYVQECIHGHRWGAAFVSVDMSDSGQRRCPECGCYKVRTVWNIPGECYMQHTKEEWDKEKAALAKGEKYRRGQLDWEPNDDKDEHDKSEPSGSN